MVNAKLVEQSLLTPEIRGSNPSIGKNLIYQLHINLEGNNKQKEIVFKRTTNDKHEQFEFDYIGDYK